MRRRPHLPASDLPASEIAPAADGVLGALMARGAPADAKADAAARRAQSATPHLRATPQPPCPEGPGGKAAP